MKFIFCFLCFINILFASSPVIKIAITKNMIPYSFIDENNKAKGILVDYWKLWASKTQQKIEFVPLTWPETLEAIKKGKVDIHSGLFMNEERKEYIKFIKPIYQTTSQIFIKVNKIKEIINIDALDNKRLGLISNSYFETYIKKNFPKIKIKTFISNDTLIDSFFKEEVDAIIDDSLIIWSHMVKRYKHNEVISLEDFAVNKWFYAAIKNDKKNINLENQINYGMSLISKKDLINIQNKWAIDKGLSFYKRKEKNFTKEELNYIKNSPALTLGLDDWGDMMHSSDGIKLEGFSGEIILKVFEISGLRYKIVKDDWNILLKKFKNKKIDILPATYFTKERSSFGLYSKKYMSLKDFIYLKFDNQNIKKLSDLNHKKLAIVKGYGNIRYVKEKFPNIKIIETNNLEDSISKVLNAEVDAFFELQFAAEAKIRELSLPLLKGIYQNDIKANDLHVFSRKDDLLLQKIIQKSLNAIPKKVMDKITKKWLNPKEKQELNIAFGKGREPYSIDKSYLKGIEYDLINEILKKSRISIKNITNLSYDKLQNALSNDTSLDIAVTVKEKDDGYYYSDDFINFENIAVSRVKDNITLNTISDLKNKNIIAFKEAYKYLGEKYFSLFNLETRTKSYKEYEYQAKQVKDFLDKKTDVIIIDKNIFLWHLKRLSDDSINKYKIEAIFPNKNAYKVAFKDEYIKNIFNKNLKILKDNGELKDIFFNYIHRDIEAKVKINSLISTLVSRFIFTNERNKIDNILKQLLKLEYIKKLEVFNNKKILLSSTSKETLKNYALQDSHYQVSNIPRKVGYIKVYFDEEKLIKHSKREQLIPRIDFFKGLDSYSYIKKVYKRFNYLNKEIIFSKKEQLFMKNNPIIRFSESDWSPLSVIEGKEFDGILNDYMKILNNKTNIHFSYVKTKKWSDVLRKFKNNEIDFIPGVANTKIIKNMGLVSNSFIAFNFAIVSNENASFISGLEALNGKILALPKGFTSNILIRSNYPGIKVIDTKTIKEALSMVSQGNADAFVGHEAVTVYNIKKYYKNLKIVGLSKEEFSHHMLIKKSHPELLSIINKVIATISQKEKDEINEKWIKTKINTAVDYSIIYTIIAVFLLILLIILYFTKKLSLAKNSTEITNEKLNENIIELNSTKDALEDSNHELQVSLENLKKTQDKLVESEKMASLGGLVAGVAHEINTPIGIGLTGSSHFLELTQDIIRKFDNEDMTRSDFQEYTQNSLELANLIFSNLKRTNHLIKSFKQISVDQTSEEKRKFELKNYINEILISINSVIKKTKIKVIVNAENKIYLNSYPGAISQIITNLIFNSINHAYEDNEIGIITIDLKNENEKTIIVYKDDGKGIKKENLSKIFDPFFTTNRNKGGTGLGLNIIYNIITSQLKGSISCDSIENIGVKFIIKI